MRNILIALVLLSISLSANTGFKSSFGKDKKSDSNSTYEIVRVKKTKKYAWVGSAWQKNSPCLEVTIKVRSEIGRTVPTYSAYFYNRNKELVERYSSPTSISIGNQETYKMPVKYKKDKRYEVYFGITERILKGDDKWKNVVIVFGHEDNRTISVYPKAEVGEFKIPGVNGADPFLPETEGEVVFKDPFAKLSK